jgi:hypothetical protein
LLFWALLWGNSGDGWSGFTNLKSWHLIGAIRVDEVLKHGQKPSDAKKENRWRAYHNAHFGKTDDPLHTGTAVFIGQIKHSRLFEFAVPFVADSINKSLLYRTVRTANGDRLPADGKHWSSYVRSCRPICDLEEKNGLKRAIILRDAIACRNDYDLLKGLRG